MKHLVAALAVASVVALAPVEIASAREFKDIVKPYYDRWGKWQKVRKEMRKRLKNGETFTGDDWFVLASVCAIQPPKGQSRILNLIERSPCRKQTIPYMVKAAENGTPRGFLQAARWTMLWDGSKAQAWQYAALAYRFSARDADLSADARGYITEIGYSPTEADTQAVNRTAMQLVANGVYPGDGPSGDVRLADLSGPDLSWLNFKNPKRCGWSDAALRVFENGVGFDERKNYPTVPAKVSIPGIANPVTSRITRQSKEEPSIVTYYLDFKGNWNGLSVLGMTDTFFEESHGVHGKGIRFAEPVDVVARKLTALGFVVNPKGGNRDQVEKRDAYGNFDGITTYIGRKKGETVFLCDEVFYASYGS